MSRIGKRILLIPEKVHLNVSADSQKIEVQGPLGSLQKTLPGIIQISISGQEIKTIFPSKTARKYYPLLGTTNSLLENWIEGVTKGFRKKLIISGLGYKCSLKANILQLNLGFSHPIYFHLPDGIQVEIKNNTILTISGIDKEKVGLVASQIRKYKKTEPYKGKGIRYEDEIVRRKVGKTASGTK